MFPRGIPFPPIWLGIVALVLSIALLLVAFRSHLGLPGQQFNVARVAADELDNLRETNEVNLDGVRVGQVRAVGYEDGRAVLTLQLDPDVELYRDTTATIRNRSPLGQKILDLASGSPDAGPLGDGVLPAEQVATVTELDTVLGALDADTRAALSVTLRELGVGVAGRGPDLSNLLEVGPDLLEDLGTVGEGLAADEADLTQFLDVSTRLAGRFEARDEHLRALVADADQMLRALGVDDAVPLERSLERLPATLDEARAALTDLEVLASAADAALQELGPGTEALGDATPDLRSVLRDGPGTFDRLGRVTGDADEAVRSLTRTAVDLRPLAPRLERALREGRPPIEHLGPYADDIPLWFLNLGAALDYGDSVGNFARVLEVATPELISGLLGTDVLLQPLQDPIICSDPYPAPGSSYDQRADEDCRR